MIINLLEIPPEGKTFICNQNTADLNEALKDLIGNKPHEAEFTIRPLQSETFELSGWIKTELPEDCSRCGLDFQFKVHEKFRELLMPKEKTPRNAKYSKPNHMSDMKSEDFSVVEYQGHHFNAGEYLHQAVALTDPHYPAPECDKTGNCVVCKKPVSQELFTYEDPGFDESGKSDKNGSRSPFSALKNIKLN